MSRRSRSTPVWCARSRAEGLPGNVRLHHADALALDLAALLAELGPPARIVANLPYSVATPLLRRFLDLRGALLGGA